MLGLDQTALLLDGLKPPAGMEIDAAVGTTFTLDLTALLAIPVAATLASGEQDGADSADLLEVVRRHADRTVLFCQAGAISVPPKYRAALTFVEQSVVEARKPPGGIFHPKIWVVRFSRAGVYSHRVLVMSRNLTFDRSWDVVVRLDEEPDAVRTMDNGGVVEFVRALPSFAARDVTEVQSNLVADLSSTLATATLAVPTPFESGSFAPLLSRRDGQPFRGTCDHALAVSPFLSEDAARSFVDTATNRAVVIARPAALDASADGVRGAHRVLRMKDAVLDAERTIDDTFDTTATDDSGSGAMLQLRGLHAKTYVQDHGDFASCWIGSANLTAGAFSTNVEMLVRLTGPVGDVGVDSLLSPSPQKNNLSWFVEEHPLPETSKDSDAEEGLSELEGHAFDVASGQVTLTLTSAGEHWDAELGITPWQLPAGVSVRARLLSLGTDQGVEVVQGSAFWPAIPLSLITPFVVLEARVGGQVRHVLVRAQLVGDPEDRRRSVIANAIASRDDFFRYLAALLGAEQGFGSAGMGEGLFTGGWIGGGSSRVLENLLVTASRNPDRLASLDQTLKQLRDRSDVAEIVPEDFHQLWDAVYAVRKGAIG
ncbi:phospholipase D family protein [Isoptericola sp. F-RaC21]|uniref:phospholipase D family protein n=1 Tax=Isoptericola sp. F-RaC21 TaxID=3141452 RepID=UPI00315B62E9